MTCSHSTNCELYVQFAADPALNLWKKHYCEGNFNTCQRYQLAQQGKAVPLTLLPNGKLLNEVRSYDDIALTALFNAIQKNRLPMVKSMVKSKANSEAMTNKDGITPLMFAASLGRTQITEFLLQAGCNPYKTDKRGDTALSMATKNGHQECVDLISDFIAKLPKDYGQETAPKKTNLMSRVLGFLRSTSPQG